MPHPTAHVKPAHPRSTCLAETDRANMTCLSCTPLTPTCLVAPPPAFPVRRASPRLPRAVSCRPDWSSQPSPDQASPCQARLALAPPPLPLPATGRAIPCPSPTRLAYPAHPGPSPTCLTTPMPNPPLPDLPGPCLFAPFPTCSSPCLALPDPPCHAYPCQPSLTFLAMPRLPSPLRLALSRHVRAPPSHFDLPHLAQPSPTTPTRLITPCRATPSHFDLPNLYAPCRPLPYQTTSRA